MGLFGKNFWGFLAGTAVGALGYGVASDYGLGSTASGALGGAAGGATSSAIGGGNAGMGALYGGVGGGAAGYFDVGQPSGGALSNLGAVDWTPVVAGAAGSLGGLAAIPPEEMPMPQQQLPQAQTSQQAPTPTGPPPVSVPMSVTPDTITNVDLPAVGKQTPTPGEVDLLNKLAGERTQASAELAKERYPVSGVPTRQEASPEERFLGIAGPKGRLKTIY